MTWRTVILTKDSKISLRLNHLVVKTDNVTTIPLSEIGQLVIENPNIVMTGHILNALSKYKITTIICDERHIPYAHINLIYGHFRQAAVIKKQVTWKAEHKDILWQQIVRNKILNQKETLNKFHPNEDLSNFNKYAEDVGLADETNREGYAAKVYFNKLFGMGFIRGRDTPVNWALNYGYSLLLSLFTRIITTKGLLTEIGIHHRNQYNHFNLASDFMEVYRPLIDYIVKENVIDTFDYDTKRKLLAIFNYKVLIKNRNQYLANSVEIYIDGLVKYLNTGQINKLSFPRLYRS